MYTSSSMQQMLSSPLARAAVLEELLAVPVVFLVLCTGSGSASVAKIGRLMLESKDKHIRQQMAISSRMEANTWPQIMVLEPQESKMKIKGKVSSKPQMVVSLQVSGTGRLASARKIMCPPLCLSICLLALPTPPLALMTGTKCAHN